MSENISHLESYYSNFDLTANCAHVLLQQTAQFYSYSIFYKQIDKLKSSPQPTKKIHCYILRSRI